NRMLTNYADHPISYLTKAMILGYNFIYNFNLKERNDKKFIDMIDLAIDLDPNNSNKAQYYKLKSYVLQVIHGYEKALEVIEVALNLDPKNFNLYIMNAFLLIGNNEYNKALEQIEQLFEDFSQQKNTLYKIKSLILYKMKRYEEGLKIMEDNFDRFPKDFNLLNNKALLLSILNRKEEAIETGKKLIERAPNIGNSHDTYGEILMTFGEYEAAIKELHQALSIDPHGWYIFDTCFKLGKCYKFIGDYNKAREFFEKGKILKERILPYERGIYINNADKFNKEIEQLREQSNKD
ncbi:MAG: tetratricopeptide repeat protein, partial [Candidatus Hodarchaeota archaeon]